MGVLDPRTPVRADHRFIKKMLKTVLDGKILEIPSEFSRVSRVFSKAGGSWEGVFRGSPRDVALLQKVLKVAYKKGHLTKQESWVSEKGNEKRNRS
jgi:hypothetical protein